MQMPIETQIIPAASFANANLNMLVPHPQLTSWVQCIWIMRPSHLNVDEKIYPDAGASLTFSISDTSVTARYLQNTSTTRYKWCGSLLHISIRFKPGGAWALLKSAISELAKQEIDVFDLDFAKDDRFQKLLEQLPRSSELTQLQLIDEWLLSSSLQLSKPVYSIQQLISEVDSTMLSPIQLAQEQGMSRRTLERHLQSKFAVTPLQLQHYARIKNARKILINSKQSLAAIALECGYYDQAHFNNHFKEQTGETPETYRKRKSALSKHL